jgi:hypothetical protein
MSTQTITQAKVLANTERTYVQYLTNITDIYGKDNQDMLVANFSDLDILNEYLKMALNKNWQLYWMGESSDELKDQGKPFGCLFYKPTQEK